MESVTESRTSGPFGATSRAGMVRRRMEHKFTGSSYTLGIEEELMILDAESLELSNSIEAILESAPEGDVKPELMESVLEVATSPCANTAEAGAELIGLRKQVIQLAHAKGLAIGSAGTHPFAMWEDQRIVARPRYRDLVSALRFVARQEIIFGVHVHVGIDDPEKAIHVANGMRVHIPVLLALSANSPFWQGRDAGMASTRTPLFGAFPRTGLPPFLADYGEWIDAVNLLVGSEAIPDPTFLWWDLRPQPRFGTLELRIMDAQTRTEDTAALVALSPALARLELTEGVDPPTGPARSRRCWRTASSPPGTAWTPS